MEFDPFILSRIQFALNISFHILFPTISIGLCWILLFFRMRFTFTQDMEWEYAYYFWVKIFALTFAIGVVSWTAVARITRSEFLRIRELEFVTASRASGAKNGKLMFRVILPNALPPIIVQSALMVGSAILFEAGLSFLGLTDPNVVSWGQVIGSNRQYILDASYTVTIPGMAIFVTVLCISLVGDGLNDALNPKLRQR